MFTPGPWTLSPSGRYVRYDVATTGNHGPNICDFDVFGGPIGERNANARLVAQSPNLFKVAKICQRWMHEYFESVQGQLQPTEAEEMDFVDKVIFDVRAES